MNRVFEALGEAGAEIGSEVNRYGGTRTVWVDGVEYQVTALEVA